MGENVALIERYFAAFGAGDIGTALDCIHPDAIWHVDGDPAVVTVGIIQGMTRCTAGLNASRPAFGR